MIECAELIAAELFRTADQNRAASPSPMSSAEGLQYHILPTDDPLRALNILREAAGLQPVSDEHDN